MKRRYNFNDDYFENIDTEDKAYFLGLLFSDGNVYEKRNRVQITLSNEDSYILDSFANHINYGGNVYSDRGKYSKLILPSEKMCKDLINLGCTPRKSLTLNFPSKIPTKLLHHFIRGCFDGDGHVSKRRNAFNINFTSSENFINVFTKVLDKINVEYTSPVKRYKDKDKSAYQVYIRSKSGDRFFKYLYKDAFLFLERKRKVAESPLIVKEKKSCSVCGNKYWAKGFCRKHYVKSLKLLHGK